MLDVIAHVSVAICLTEAFTKWFLEVCGTVEQSQIMLGVLPMAFSRNEVFGMSRKLNVLVVVVLPRPLLIRLGFLGKHR